MQQHLQTIAGTIVLAALFLTGCTNVATFDYAAAPGTMVKLREQGAGTRSIAVLPFLDQRGLKQIDPSQKALAQERPAGDHGSFYWGLLPLVPAGYVEKEEPENSEDFVSLGWFRFSPQEDLSNAALLSLKASNLFSSAVRANRPEQAQTHYLWRGKVLSTYYCGRMYSYLITYFLAPGLWAVGAPSGSSKNELWMDFELVERSSGQVVWTYRYRGCDSIAHWIYARIGQDASLYASLMKQAMNAALYDLNRKIPNL